MAGHYLWDPATGATEERPVGTESDLFCAGHATLADGRLFVIGGGGGDAGTAIPDVYQFDPVSETWATLAEMTVPRWYPTATILPDGRVLASGGVLQVYGSTVSPPYHEAYDPATNSWDTVLNLPFNLHVYPPMYVQRDGKILFLGWRTDHYLFDIQEDSFEAAPSGFFGGLRNGSSAMVRPDKILKVGGDGIHTNGFSTDMTEVLDLGEPSPAWRLTGHMAYPRRRPDLVLLPTGEALVVGGSVDGQNSPECAVHAAELWDPDSETWTTMASSQSARIYHSTALLLPDGRVLAAGGENTHTGGDRTTEVYSPPYLFKGPRPRVDDAPGSIAYGAVFPVETPDPIASVALMRPGSVTHNYDQNQRFLPLEFKAQAGGIAVTAPADANLAPPGYYMLFLLSPDGVPSVARFVKLAGACNDGIDNDGDGLVDSVSDPGCATPWADTESPQCNDGIDNDLDGAVDLDDPGCDVASRRWESPQCSDGLNNDPLQDDGIDYDGGLWALGYVAGAPDPECVGRPWHAKESRCGLGAELVLLLPLLRRLRRARGAPRAGA